MRFHRNQCTRTGIFEYANYGHFSAAIISMQIQSERVMSLHRTKSETLKFYTARTLQFFSYTCVFVRLVPPYRQGGY